jgi:hypothetical protein
VISSQHKQSFESDTDRLDRQGARLIDLPAAFAQDRAIARAGANRADGGGRHWAHKPLDQARPGTFIVAPAHPALRRPLNFAESSTTLGSVNVPRLAFNFRLGFVLLRSVQFHSDQTCSNQHSGPKIRGSKFNIT